MIDLTGMNNKEFTLNADHIEKVEEVPETIITLTNGKKYIVLESVAEVKEQVIRYKNKIINFISHLVGFIILNSVIYVSFFLYHHN